MNKIVIIILILISSCKENKTVEVVKNDCDDLANKLQLIKESNFYKFQKILERETKTGKDTLLLKDYKDLNGKNELLDLYVWDRINSIKNEVKKSKFLAEFSGEYVLKPNHNSKNSYANIIKINQDSCYIFKNNKLLTSDKIRLINSSNKLIKGRIIIGEFKMSFDGSLSRKLLLLDNNLCMDCEQLQFIK